MIELIKIYLNKNKKKRYIYTEHDFYEMYPDYNEIDIHMSQPLLIYQEKWKKFEYYLNNEFVKKDFFLKKYPSFDFDFYNFMYLKSQQTDTTYMIKDFLQNMDNYYSISHFYELNPSLDSLYLEFYYPSENPYEVILKYLEDPQKEGKIYSDLVFLQKYVDFDIELYCTLYTIEFKQNETPIYLNYISSRLLGENRIYSEELFYTMYSTFDKAFYENVYECHEKEIIYHYFKNPESFIHRPAFDAQYPEFDILFYKGLRMETNKMYSSYEIIRHFLNNTYKHIYNKAIFDATFPSFDIEMYAQVHQIDSKNPLLVYRHFINNEQNIYNMSQFYKKNPYFDYEFYSLYVEKKWTEKEAVIEYMKNKIQYCSMKLFYNDFPFFESDFYARRLKYSQVYLKNEMQLVIYFLKHHMENSEYIYSSKQFYTYYPSFSISEYREKHIELKHISDHEIMVYYLEIGMNEDESAKEESVSGSEIVEKKEELTDTVDDTKEDDTKEDNTKEVPKWTETSDQIKETQQEETVETAHPEDEKSIKKKKIKKNKVEHV